ncbi:tRNA pseudouridine(38-40) synthase TruA [Reichenbachiella sp. MALMAid0571]|uniref:tRNA pseudouridine(38-40) synthase TruA n=1 Tax=Reichenbachiella sp. MALMAid0571 TaxID=3143939 RepID=UPI0032DE3F75
MRYFIEISYNGTAYHGWQIQKNATSIQGKINDALSKKLRLTTTCLGSGRTDTGVHALVQIAQFDTEEPISGRDNFIFQLNSMLPNDISVNNIIEVTQDASARFDAISRSYLYKVHCRKNPFLDGRSYFFSQPLDIYKMNEACKLLHDWTDFQAFSKVHTDVHTFNCNILKAEWKRENDLLTFSVTANRFLRGMVRALVGTMLDVGQNKTSLENFKGILTSRDRRNAGRSVPACGLYLSDITYPDSIKL